MKRGGFSLIEVIFVLVILGIVASIASQIIVQVYENYILQRAIYNLSIKTELVANQIVNRLTYRIEGTTISKDHLAFLSRTVNSNDWLPIEDVPIGGDKYTTIEWIGYDNDSFASDANPNWSGVANYEYNVNRGRFVTPGSNLSKTSTIISNLSNGKVDLTPNRPAGLLFIENNNFYRDSKEYNPLCMGMIPELNASSRDCIFPVYNDTNNSLTFTRSRDTNHTIRPKIITERYKLAWSAYAIAPTKRKPNGLYDLILYSNYQPWNGDSYLDTNTTKHTLITNLSVFKFSETGGTIHFKLCAVEELGDNNITTCKEKVVIR